MLTETRVMEIVQEEQGGFVKEIKGYFKAVVEDLDSKMLLVLEKVENLSDSVEQLRHSNEQLCLKVDVIYNGLIEHINNRKIHLKKAKPKKGLKKVKE